MTRPGGAPEGAPPAEPLRLVATAVAGGDLTEVARAGAEACGRPVLIVLADPARVVCWPPDGDVPRLAALAERVRAAAAEGRTGGLPEGVCDLVPIRLGPEVVGAVAALGDGPAELAVRRWLDAAAAASAVATLMTTEPADEPGEAPGALLAELELAGAERRQTSTGAAAEGLAERVRRVGIDPDGPTVAFCLIAPGDLSTLAGTARGLGARCGPVGAERLLGLLDAAGAATAWDQLVAAVTQHGARLSRVDARGGVGALATAVWEAALLAELDAGAPLPRSAEDRGEARTVALLVGVHGHAPEELADLRASTIAPLEDYDAAHDTDLLATLGCFLAHEGSTTETAETMGLHRHTVGYRLARVQEVAGLSPYTSAGRERLSLGLKADRILAAEARRRRRAAAG